MVAIMKLWSIVTREELRRSLINQAAEANRMRSALEDVYALACGPPGARTNDIIRKKCLSALEPKPEQRNAHHHPDLGEETKRAISNQENMIDD